MPDTRPIPRWMAVVCLAIGSTQTGVSQQQAPTAVAVVNQYCAGCHNDRLKTGGFVLDTSTTDEQFAAWMQEMRRTVVVGERTPGRDLDASMLRLPSGGLFLYAYGEPRTPKGVVIEGRGVIPDAEVRLRREDLLRGVDPQLEAAAKTVKLAGDQKSQMSDIRRESDALKSRLIS